MDNKTAARPYLEEALKMGVTQAEEVLKEISINRYVITKTKTNKQYK